MTVESRETLCACAQLWKRTNSWAQRHALLLGTAMVTAVAIVADCSWDEYFLGQFGYIFGPAAIGAAFLFAVRIPQKIVAGFFGAFLAF